MRKNLFDEWVSEPIDFAKEIVKEFQTQDGIRFAPNLNKIKGFDYWNNQKFPGNFTGHLIYCIYKDGDPVYVGCSRNVQGLRDRMGRFCCQLTGKTKTAGEHPGAKKYKKIFKEDYSNLYVKYSQITKNLPDGIKLEEIELEIIRILKPICNNEIYKSNWTAMARLELA